MMRYGSHSTAVKGRANQNETPPCHMEFCEETGERMFRAGDYAAPGEYVEMETGRWLTLASPDFLPARLDGKTACYRLRYGWGATEEQSLAQRQAQFHALVTHSHKRLYQFVRRSLPNPQDAEDLTQEALARAWSYFETFDSRQSFDAWVFRIARNLLIDQSRRRRRRQEISLDAPVAELEESERACNFEIADSTGNPEHCLMTEEICEGLQSAVYCLPAIYRKTLLLVAQQHSYEHIARVLDCSVGTVRSRVHRARTLARRNLKESMLYE